MCYSLSLNQTPSHPLHLSHVTIPPLLELKAQHLKQKDAHGNEEILCFIFHCMCLLLQHTWTTLSPCNFPQTARNSDYYHLSIYLSMIIVFISPFCREREVMESAIQTMVKVFLKSSKGRESLGKKEFQNLVSSQLGNILTVRKSLLKSQNCCLYLDYVIIFHKSRQWCCVSPGQP